MRFLVTESLIAGFLLVSSTEAFNAQLGVTSLSPQTTTTSLQATKTDELAIQKAKLFKLLGTKPSTDNVLEDPVTKEPIEISASGALLGGDSRSRVPYTVKSASNSFKGSSDSFIDLLEPATEGENTSSSSSSSPLNDFLQRASPYVPVPLRGPLASLTDGEYIPMRDLFTSPAVSFAYERGWRQGFAQAGFPGPDIEAEMAMDYFAPVAAVAPGGFSKSVIVDMSCATGLFTRRFASTDRYGRVLGCDYSESMLTEARRRIKEQRSLAKLKTTKLDLVRLDVGQIPMRNESIDCLHAGAAMHCWPDLDSAFTEIYRVLKPGGRYFGTTFLSSYFATLSSMDGQGSNVPSQQAFQYFESVDSLEALVAKGGFDRSKIQIEVLGNACAVIRAEK
ncbi:unnamed protein product [Cylindrotheca closterium]|uniref:Methyltransferase type 11 domain-containing protein n=1 Tax=Cylindrotheca closterium TaxID=2856 RepID=A0AAD2JMA7_9STRA|nr:unnamed protein product [Cylindrotheca closterium]